MPAQDKGIATDTIFTFNVTASDSLTDFADVYWPLNHSPRMLTRFPNPKSLNVEEFVIQHTLPLLETGIFKKPARGASSTDNNTGLTSGCPAPREAETCLSRCAPSPWHSTLWELSHQYCATLMDRYGSTGAHPDLDTLLALLTIAQLQALWDLCKTHSLVLQRLLPCHVAPLVVGHIA